VTLSEPIKIAIAGAEGRMGRAVAAALEERTDMIAVAGFDRRVLREAGLVPLEEAVAAADVVIDFTSPEASAALAERLAELGGKALVSGPPGWTDEQLARVARAAQRRPVVRAGSFSLGVNRRMGRVRQAAAARSPATTMSRSSRPTTAARWMLLPAPP